MTSRFCTLTSKFFSLEVMTSWKFRSIENPVLQCIQAEVAKLGPIELRAETAASSATAVWRCDFRVALYASLWRRFSSLKFRSYRHSGVASPLTAPCGLQDCRPVADLCFSQEEGRISFPSLSSPFSLVFLLLPSPPFHSFPSFSFSFPSLAFS